MEWWAVLSLFLAGIIAALVSGIPIAFVFLLVDIVGVLFFMGPQGLTQITLQIFNSLSTFSLTPIPLFILMGELLFHSGMAYKTLDVMDTWLGRIPGRLSVLAAASGTMFAAMSGSTIADTAMLGTVLLPEMRRRNYSTSMAVGPIVAAGPLAALIPPSSLAVVLASIGRIPVGDMLLGGVGPGVILGLFFCVYIMVRCWLNPSLAPHYERTRLSFASVSSVHHICAAAGIYHFQRPGPDDSRSCHPDGSGSFRGVGDFGGRRLLPPLDQKDGGGRADWDLGNHDNGFHDHCGLEHIQQPPRLHGGNFWSGRRCARIASIAPDDFGGYEHRGSHFGLFHGDHRNNDDYVAYFYANHYGLGFQPGLVRCDHVGQLRDRYANSALRNALVRNERSCAAGHYHAGYYPRRFSLHCYLYCIAGGPYCLSSSHPVAAKCRPVD